MNQIHMYTTSFVSSSAFYGVQRLGWVWKGTWERAAEREERMGYWGNPYKQYNPGPIFTVSYDGILQSNGAKSKRTKQ